MAPTVLFPHYLRIAATAGKKDYDEIPYENQDFVPTEQTNELREKLGMESHDIVDSFASCSGDFAAALRVRRATDINPRMVEFTRKKITQETKAFRANAGFTPTNANAPDYLFSFEPYDVDAAIFLTLLRGMAYARKKVTLAFRQKDENHFFGNRKDFFVSELSKVAGHYNAEIKKENIVLTGVLKGKNPARKNVEHLVLSFKLNPEEKRKAQLDCTLIDALNHLAIVGPTKRSGTSLKQRVQKASEIYEKFVYELLASPMQDNMEQTMQNIERHLPATGFVTLPALMLEIQRRKLTAGRKEVLESLGRINRITAHFTPILRAKVEVRTGQMRRGN